MKKATLIIWAIVFGFIALVIFQNQDFFMPSHSLRLNLGVIEEYHSPQLPVAVMVLIFFFSGVVITYLFNFLTRFKTRRTIKKLNATMASHQDEVSGLKREIDSLKGIETPIEGSASETKNGMDKTQIITSKSLPESPAEQTSEFSIEKLATNPTENPEEKSGGKNS